MSQSPSFSGPANRALALLVSMAAASSACTTSNGSAVDAPDSDAGASGGAGGSGGSAGGQGGGVSGGTGGTGAGGTGGSAAGGADAGSGGALADAGISEACGPVCERVADCAAEVCGEAAAGARAAIVQDCATTCSGNPSFEIVAGGIETCGDLVDFGRQSLGATFNTVCDAAAVPDEVFPVCDIFGERLSTCLVEACPAMAAVAGAAAGAYRYYCNGAANNGELDPDQLAMYLTPETPCSTQFLADIVAEQTGEGGDLAPFCAHGPYNSPQTCAAACADIGPCIQPGADGQELRDADFCAYVCAISASPSPTVWECLEATGPEQCEAAGACFALNTPPDVPECAPYAARVATCTAETCPTVAPYDAGLEYVLGLYCNQAVQSDPNALPVVSAVTPETPCDDPAIASLVVGLTADDPAREDDGTLAPYCAGTSAMRDAATCAAACERLSPCLPDTADARALRNTDYCTFFCGTDQGGVTPEQWACVGAAMVGDCDTTLGCFQAP